MSINKRKSIFAKIGLTAAALIIAFAIGTNAGKAAVSKIKDIFVPQKVIVQDIEGQKEDTKVNLNESNGYVIYIDENNYKLIKQDGKDKIIPKIKLDDRYPEVYMEIQQIKDKSPQEMATQIENELRSRFENVENKGIIEQPIRAIFIYARSGLKWNDTVVKYYLVDNKKGGTFVIKQQLFIEATEGHGVRFDNMLKEFKVISSD
ncbi:hypothetical protein [Caldanaerobius polysaccharolyticus]|uniref:hypothetical protein n=1 Tax=Caldanaerobius polysaccharolyticus TaxID=44256 RepID=UPI0004793AF2|nr:hypothetical protein [Caldanaerobius polysaccharolyticus]